MSTARLFRMTMLGEQTRRGARDIELLVQRYDIDFYRRVDVADAGLASVRAPITLGVQHNSEHLEAGAYPLAHEVGMLTNATAEHDRIRASQYRQVGADILAYAVTEHLDG